MDEMQFERDKKLDEIWRHILRLEAEREQPKPEKSKMEEWFGEQWLLAVVAVALLADKFPEAARLAAKVLSP